MAGCSSNGNTGNGGGNNGEPVSLDLHVRPPDEDPVFHEYCQLIQANWQELGIDVSLKTESFNSLIERAIDNHNFETLSMSFGGRAERIDPDSFLYQFFHSSFTDKGEYNYRGWENDEFDELAEQQRTIYDQEERQEPVYEAQRIFAEEQPLAPVLAVDNLMPYRTDRISNVDPMVGEGLMSFWNFMNLESQKGEIIFGYPSEVNSFNPLDQPLTFDTQIQRLVYDTLTRVDSDGTSVEWAAEAVESEDETTVRVTLRDELQFHDGEPLTAEDVKFSFEYIDQHATVLSSQTEKIDSIEIEDDQTVVFNLSQPYSPFISNSLGTVYLLPKHIWENIPDEIDDVDNPLNYSNNEPIGSGPFMVESWRRQEELQLTAFTDHFEQANVDSVIMIPGSGMQNMVRQLEQGQLDMITYNIQPTTAERLMDTDQIEVSQSPNHGFHHIDFRHPAKPLNDSAVRRALAYAIPKEDIVDTILQGYGRAAHSPIVSSNEYWHNPDVPKFGSDMEAARQELEEAGYEWNDDGNLLMS